MPQVLGTSLAALGSAGSSAVFCCPRARACAPSLTGPPARAVSGTSRAGPSVRKCADRVARTVIHGRWRGKVCGLAGGVFGSLHGGAIAHIKLTPCRRGLSPTCSRRKYVTPVTQRTPCHVHAPCVSGAGASFRPVSACSTPWEKTYQLHPLWGLLPPRYHSLGGLSCPCGSRALSGALRGRQGPLRDYSRPGRRVKASLGQVRARGGQLPASGWAHTAPGGRGGVARGALGGHGGGAGRVGVARAREWNRASRAARRVRSPGNRLGARGVARAHAKGPPPK